MIPRADGSLARHVGARAARLVAALIITALMAVPLTASAQPIGSPVDMSVEPGTQTHSVGQTASVTITETDANGHGVPGSNIVVDVSGANTIDDYVVTTGEDGSAVFSYIGNAAGQDTVLIYGYGSMMDQVTVTWLGPAATVSLEPADSQVEIGVEQTFIATVKDAGKNLLQDVPVIFSVSGANETSGSATTSGTGTAAFSYGGTAAGTDTVTAWADNNGNGTMDEGEPSASVEVTWTTTATNPPPENPGGENPPASTEPFGPADAVAAIDGCTYFAQTGHNICDNFQSYWDTFGGLAVFGMPLTEPFTEGDATIQYFERARFEYRPGSWAERFDIELGLVGDEITADRLDEMPFQPVDGPPDPNKCTYYEASGHNLCAGFRAYWEEFGGLAIYGMPISEEFVEKNPDTGQNYTVQYFERGRFEWHPGEWPERYDVMLGRLGAEVLTANYNVTRY